MKSKINQNKNLNLLMYIGNHNKNPSSVIHDERSQRMTKGSNAKLYGFSIRKSEYPYFVWSYVKFIVNWIFTSLHTKRQCRMTGKKIACAIDTKCPLFITAKRMSGRTKGTVFMSTVWLFMLDWANQNYLPRAIATVKGSTLLFAIESQNDTRIYVGFRFFFSSFI